MDYIETSYANGYLERKPGGYYEGELHIDGVNISPIEGAYFKQDGQTYLWVKRKPKLEYDPKKEVYVQKAREPEWEAYLEKQGWGQLAYKGTFAFLHFRYSIVGLWDVALGKERQRLNFMVERLPEEEQTIIRGINERKKRRRNE